MSTNENNIYEEIKNELIDNEINKRVKDYSKNKYELERYYNVGKLLNEAGKHYGEGVIKRYSIKLTRDLGKGYSITNLKNMRKFYTVFQKSQAVPDQLSWSHFCELVVLNNIDSINYYIEITKIYNLGYRQLRERIKSREYERLPESTKNKLKTQEANNVTDFIKDPIIIKTNEKECISEKVLQKSILEDIESFMQQLGSSFSFIGSEYKIKLGDTYNYIDLLLFNIEYNCYVVIELKVTELKKEHIGQIQVYMNYIDNNLKRITQEKTIGIIICKKDNKLYIEYSSDKRIYSTTYVLK